jgi:DNA-binding CsgD family transcriptional regulator
MPYRDGMAATAAATRSRIREQQRTPAPGALFADDVMTSLGRAVGFDGYCLFGVDPATQIRSVMFSRHGLSTATERLVHNETVEHDANRYRELAVRPLHAGVLAAGVAAEPSSPRLHEMLRPEGYHSELRLALVAGGRYWGALSLFRDDPRRPFTDEHADVAHQLGDVLAAAIRRYQVGVLSADHDAPPLTGVVVYDHSGRVLQVSDHAHAWLTRLADSWDDGAVEQDVMRVVREVADAAAERTAGVPLCRVRMPRGGWLVVSGTKVDTGEVDVVVHLRAGDVRTVLPAFAAWCGLTDRESHVLSLLADGEPAKRMARRLSLSVLTVNDHLRSIYRKADVRGRDELMALLL